LEGYASSNTVARNWTWRG